MQEGIPNRSPEEILQEIAGNHGLTLHLDSSVSASGMAGKTFNFQEFQFQADNENEWDVAHHIAELLGCEVSIHGKDMYVEPPGTTNGGTYA